MKKKIVLGVSSSIAAYKACELVRLFVKSNHDVFVIMTENATKLISPLTFEGLSQNPVSIETFTMQGRRPEHTSLQKDAKLFLIAPATANIIGKFACGIADDLMSTTFMTVTCPTLIAPAMHPNMWNSPSVKNNVKSLMDQGIKFVEPLIGEVISGEEGKGHIAPIDEIFNKSIQLIREKEG